MLTMSLLVAILSKAVCRITSFQGNSRTWKFSCFHPLLSDDSLYNFQFRSRSSALLQYDTFDGCFSSISQMLNLNGNFANWQSSRTLNLTLTLLFANVSELWKRVNIKRPSMIDLDVINWLSSSFFSIRLAPQRVPSSHFIKYLHRHVLTVNFIKAIHYRKMGQSTTNSFPRIMTTGVLSWKLILDLFNCPKFCILIIGKWDENEANFPNWAFILCVLKKSFNGKLPKSSRDMQGEISVRFSCSTCASLNSSLRSNIVKANKKSFLVLYEILIFIAT